MGQKNLLNESLDAGVKPKVANLVDRSILNRISGVVDTVLGDPNAAKNSVAINKRVDSLRKSF